jgi:glycosyltransferase involved in cell wall biosynthesis
MSYELWERDRLTRLRKPGEPLRFVFVGKDWRRKGLDRLIRAFVLARQAGLKASLRVIGCERRALPNDLGGVDGIEWLGYLSKRRDCGRFLRAVGECDAGCLLSRMEAGGVALREYHALGLVTIGPDTGGAPEHMIAGASVGVSPAAPDSEIADLLLKMGKDEVWFERLKKTAWELRHSALWENSIQRLAAFWPEGRV